MPYYYRCKFFRSYKYSRNFKNFKNIDKKRIKFYQASTSEMFGNVANNKKINETTPMHPVSPYGVSKLYSYHMIKIYREAYDLFLSNGILFNHESPYRTEHFVTKKLQKEYLIFLLAIKKNYI